MEPMPLVSVIISSYNHAPYVEASIGSVLQQTYPHIELLVVDDGSSDDSVNRIRRLQQEHGFDFRTQPNQGLARTLNDCLARASGSLIAPFGSDDIMRPERIATQVAYLQDKPEVGICAGNIETIDSQGQVVPGRDRHRPFRRLDFDAMFAGEKARVMAPTLLFRREALEAAGGFDPSVALEDLLVELRITHAGYFIDVLEDVLASYRIHDHNTYKNRRLMVANVLQTYAHFADHPAYAQVRLRYLRSMFLKCAREDRAFARELLAQVPLRHWNLQVVRGLLRLLSARR